MRVIFHDVPQYRSVSDLHQWLRNILGEFSQSGSQPSAEQHNFHVLPTCQVAWMNLTSTDQAYLYSRSNPFLQSRPAAVSITSKGKSARSAISSSEQPPSDKFSTHSMANSVCVFSVLPPICRYNPRFPN